MKKKEDIQFFSFRLSASLKKRLDEMSKNLSKPKAAILREALELYLNENELEDFSSAISALEELKDGDYKKARKKLDKIIKDLQGPEFSI